MDNWLKSATRKMKPDISENPEGHPSKKIKAEY
jgi:hypothetical protein